MSELRGYCESHIVGFLRDRGQRPPMLRRVVCLINTYRDDLVIEFQFEDAPDYSLALDRRLTSHVSPRQTDQLCAEVQSLYSRLAEDHILHHDTSRATAYLRQLMAEGAPPSQIEDLRRRIDEACRHQRQYHGTPLAEPRGTTSAIAQASTRSRSYGYSPGQVALDELTAFEERLTATQLQTLQRVMLDRIDREVFPRGFGVDMATGPDWTTYGGGFGADVGDAKANRKGLKLLREWLSPEQREQYKKSNFFEVIGSDTGKRYRIRHGRQMNIDELDAKGEVACGWCFLPEGQLVAGDVMLAQKIALETFETDALKKANRFGAHGTLSPGTITWVDEANEMPRRLVDGHWGMALRPGAVSVIADPTS